MQIQEYELCHILSDRQSLVFRIRRRCHQTARNLQEKVEEVFQFSDGEFLVKRSITRESLTF